MRGLNLWGAILLLVSSLVLLIPALYFALNRVTAGRPWIQILLGLVGLIVAIAEIAERAGEEVPSKGA